MKFRKINTDALKLFSYYISDGGVAAVIDPKTDIEIYLRLAAEDNAKIKYVFETHRHEDMISGAKLLGEKSGADVYISGYEDLGHEYGIRISEEDTFVISDLLEIFPLHTPGHTLGHLSYLLKYDGRPYMVFTGDSLFYGGVGRMDFYGKENLEKMAALQYDSIFNKLAKLGDEVLVMPGHGAGSACGNDLDDIPYSTIGYELKHNSALYEQKDEFISHNAVINYKNPAFTTMEVENLKGSGIYKVELPPIIKLPTDAIVIDLRSSLNYHSGSIPGSLSMPTNYIPSFLGYLIDTSQKLVLFSEKGEDDLQVAANLLYRTGFHNVVGALGTGTLEDYESENTLLRIERISVDEYKERLKNSDTPTLDVRKKEELTEELNIPNIINIPLQELRNRLDELKANEIFILCQSSARSSVAASFIAQNTGIKPIVVAGGVSALSKY